MSYLILKELPRYECLVNASRHYPDLDVSAVEAFLHMLRSGDEVQRTIQEHLERHGVSQGRFLVMMLLMRKEGTECCGLQTPAELAEQAQVSRATMTGLLDTLERDKFVRRRPDAQDRRRILVALTPKGERFMEATLPRHFRLIARLHEPLSERERKTLVTLLQKVGASAQALRTELTKD